MDERTDLRSHVTCVVCECEVPLSEAVVPEASDYVAYFCGLDCYDRWHTEAMRCLLSSIL